MVYLDEVKNYIQNNIIIVSIGGGAVALKDTNYFDEVLTNDQISGNVFWVNDCIVKMKKCAIKKIEYKGLFFW